MGIEPIIALISGVLAAFLGALKPLLEKVLYPIAEKHYFEHPDTKWSKFLQLWFVFDNKKKKSFRDRLADSIDTLRNSTAEIDNVIEEIGQISKEKHQTIENLQKQLDELESRENELKNKIETMEKVPIESLKHFEEILNNGNKRGAKRDYLIFISGIVITTIIAILLNKFL